MRILQLAPLWFPVTNDAQGGIETFLTALIAELEKLGCHNTLLASGDSRTAADLLPVVPQNLCHSMEVQTAWEYAYFEQHQLFLALEHAAEFDVIHSHIGPSAYALSAVSGLCERTIHTQHNPVMPDLEWLVSQHPDLWLTTVSEFQAHKLWKYGASRCQVIHNGIDIRSFTPRFESGSGLCFLGRMEYEKGPDLAIRAARNLGLSLTIAGPIVDQSFFDREIGPFLNDGIRYVGTVGHRGKNELFANAACAILPSRWDEPFGLVAIEAMACGTPVVTLANGALPEIVEPGRTGFIAHEESELAPLVLQAMELDRALVQTRAAARFDIQRAAQQFYQLYQRVIEQDQSGPPVTAEAFR